ncbi:MAG TPA: hypothetical protein VN152_11395 [Sphingopyxis sp.]|nr:hypothetical protein [Sphingopyxis sp.]
MARYFFHIVDGAIGLDDLGMELASPDDAKRAAIRYGANLLADDPGHRLPDNGLRINVTTEDGQLSFALLILAVDGRQPGSPLEVVDETVIPVPI